MTVALSTTPAAAAGESTAPTPSPTVSGRRAVNLAAISVAGPLALLALLFVYPLVTVARQSFQDQYGASIGLTAWRQTLGASWFRTSLVTTVEIAVGATIGCVVLGTFIAVVLAFVPFRGSAAIARTTTIVLAFPSFFIALSFVVLYGPVGVGSAVVDAITGGHEALGQFVYSRWAVLLAEITFYTPFVVRPVLAACQQMPVEQLQVAASLGARPWRVVRRVLLPELMPTIVAGAGLALMLTVNEFGIVMFIGAKNVQTVPALIYNKGVVSFHQYPAAAVLACVQVVLSLVLYAAMRVCVSRFGGRRAGLD